MAAPTVIRLKSQPRRYYPVAPTHNSDLRVELSSVEVELLQAAVEARYSAIDKAYAKPQDRERMRQALDRLTADLSLVVSGCIRLDALCAQQAWRAIYHERIREHTKVVGVGNGRIGGGDEAISDTALSELDRQLGQVSRLRDLMRLEQKLQVVSS